MLLVSSCLKLLVPCVIPLSWPAVPAHIHLQGNLWSDSKERTYLGARSQLCLLLSLVSQTPAGTYQWL